MHYVTIIRYSNNKTAIRYYSLLEDFYLDCAGDSLPNISLVTLSLGEGLKPSQHPGFSPMSAGYDLIRQVYEAIRQNETVWAKTLLIITYDVRAWCGYWDHISKCIVRNIESILYRYVVYHEQIIMYYHINNN